MLDKKSIILNFIAITLILQIGTAAFYDSTPNDSSIPCEDINHNQIKELTCTHVNNSPIQTRTSYIIHSLIAEIFVIVVLLLFYWKGLFNSEDWDEL